MHRLYDVQAVFGDSIFDIIAGAARTESAITWWNEQSLQVLLNGWRSLRGSMMLENFFCNLQAAALTCFSAWNAQFNAFTGMMIHGP